MALKDSERFDGGWAYFDFSNGRQAAEPFARGQCADCHAEHTQFYPVLRRVKAGL
ncbi:MAG: cytochrome P460 family protein [bacterium]|nr:cytochrome P460 family protein [bacterium]